VDEDACMKLPLTLFTFSIVLLNSLLAEAEFKPSQLENLVKQAGSRTVWSGESGRIESSESRAVVTAMVVEDRAKASRVRGVRIDFSGRDLKATIYVDDSGLKTVKTALDEITRGMELSGYGDGGTRSSTLLHIGSCDYRDNPTAHPFTAVYYIDPGIQGLKLFPLNQGEFNFPNRKPAQLSAALRRAMDELAFAVANSNN
jgi:hypothetical protein